MSVHLPKPQLDSETSLEKCLAGRRSVRALSAAPVTLAEVSQLLWAGQGITSPLGFRTAPSAGALYPLTIHLVAGKVKNLEPGVYRYIPEKHQLSKTLAADRRMELTRAALSQQSINASAFSLVIAAVYEKTTSKYGQRGIRYVYMDAGHAAQNVCLQAVIYTVTNEKDPAYNRQIGKAVGSQCIASGFMTEGIINIFNNKKYKTSIDKGQCYTANNSEGSHKVYYADTDREIKGYGKICQCCKQGNSLPGCAFKPVYKPADE